MEPVALARISRPFEDSLSYLEQLFGKLRRHKLVDSVRGPGAVFIARPLEVRVADIIPAPSTGNLTPPSVADGKTAHDEHRCMTHDLWTTLNSKMYEYLSSVTMAELVQRERGKREGMAVIEDQRRLGPSRAPGGVTRCRQPSDCKPCSVLSISITMPTPPLDPAVLAAMLPWLESRFGNASSRHEYGRQARQAGDEAGQGWRRRSSHPGGGFTSGGSETNNLFIKGRLLAWKPG